MSSLDKKPHLVQWANNSTRNHLSTLQSHFKRLSLALLTNKIHVSDRITTLNQQNMSSLEKSKKQGLMDAILSLKLNSQSLSLFFKFAIISYFAIFSIFSVFFHYWKTVRFSWILPLNFCASILISVKRCLAFFMSRSSPVCSCSWNQLLMKS